MKLYQVVFKDFRRRKRRVLYAALGVIIGTMTVVGILTMATAAQARILDQLERYGANLTVVPSVKSISMELGRLSVGMVTVGENFITEDKVAQVRQIADGEIRKALNIIDETDIATVAPKLYLTAEVKGSSVILVGVNPSEEKRLKTWWKMREGRYLEGSHEAIVGAVGAELLGLKVGDRVSLNSGEITITGILDETGSSEDYQAFLPLDTLQKLFNKEGLVSSIDVRALCNACPVEYIAEALNQTIPGIRAVAVKQIATTEMGMIEKVNHFMLALAGVTLLVGGFGVANTLMTSVHERRKDIGIMRAVGASRGQIIRVLVYEAVAIGVIGGLLGYGAGTLLAYGLGPFIFEGTTVTLAPSYLPLSLAVALLISIVATLYPAYRATRIRVADSFRSL